MSAKPPRHSPHFVRPRIQSSRRFSASSTSSSDLPLRSAWSRYFPSPSNSRTSSLRAVRCRRSSRDRAGPRPRPGGRSRGTQPVELETTHTFSGEFGATVSECADPRCSAHAAAAGGALRATREHLSPEVLRAGIELPAVHDVPPQCGIGAGQRRLERFRSRHVENRAFQGRAADAVDLDHVFLAQLVGVSPQTRATRRVGGIRHRHRDRTRSELVVRQPMQHRSGEVGDHAGPARDRPMAATTPIRWRSAGRRASNAARST